MRSPARVLGTPDPEAHVDDVGADPGAAVTTHLHVVVTVQESIAVLVVVGEVDLESAPRLREALHEPGVRGGCDVVVDVTGLRFCGAIGMGILAEAAQGLAPEHSLTVAGADGLLRRLLHVMGVDELVHVTPPPVRR